MELIPPRNLAIEAAQYDHSLRCLVMVGSENICEHVTQGQKFCSTDHSFAAVYGLNNHFYYRIDQIENGQTVVFEVGIGLVEVVENKVALKRTNPLIYKFKNEEPRVIVGETIPSFNTTDKIIVSSYVPTSIGEALPEDNMVITSIAPHTPHPIKLPKNSVLGRLEDDVQPITLSDLPTVVTSYPSTSQAPQIKGIIIYDEGWDILKYFNGKEWRELG